MKSLRRFFLILASLFLVYQTWQLMEILIALEGQDLDWFVELTIAFLINLFVTGIFAFVGFGFPIHRLLPKDYYSVKSPNTVTQLYKKLGVSAFRKILMLFFWGKEKNRKKYFNGTRAGIQNFVYQTKQSEFGHLAALIVIAVLSIVLAFYGYERIAVIALVINLIGNLYPILLQRHHRMRLGKFGERL